jgi:hypothetical protein
MATASPTTPKIWLRPAVERHREPACRDGIDNDGDGFADHPKTWLRPAVERHGNPACRDGIDNDTGTG